jgi:carbon-monoxide dehydrogenase medium subunit
MRFRKATPGLLVDIGALTELRGVTVNNGAVRIGAATTYRELLGDAALQAALPLVPEVAELVGDLQLRNRGTIGGALVYADPFADMPVVMMALDATLHLQSSAGTRTVRARDFFRGAFQTALLPGELLIAIDIPATPARTGTAYANFEKSASGYSQVGAAAVVTRDAAGLVRAATLGITSVSAAPFLAATDALIGTAGNAEIVAQVAAAALHEVPVYPDPHTTPEYRRHLATVAARRALATALAAAS